MTVETRKTVVVVHDHDGAACCDDESLLVTCRGEIVCRHCGTCFGSNMVSEPARAYTIDEMNSRRMHEIVSVPFGTRTMMGGNRDAAGNVFEIKRQWDFRRLDRINRSTISSKERNYSVSLPYLRKRASDLSIPFPAREMAWNIYKRGQGKGIVSGRSVRATVAASLYIACRASKIAVHSERFIDGEFSKKIFRKTCRLLVQEVLPELGLKYVPVKPEEMVPIIANAIGVGIDVQMKAIKLARTISTAIKIENAGKDPRGFAAALIYIVCKEIEMKKTQVEIARAASITEVTLRSRLKEIETILK